ncbi:MAG: aminotransferase class I/II-fold pyridoxal phosphate-dependent enzyme [Treponema sp.]|nr:aminotransferase class I/II-fold pyridoxal phosphate-dependent enzyme [Treponema sp.]MCL2251682.1 aminotransferase class I/II-fold pyridoxal phosphate-dependent enzyme [Treponema sp.]
MQDKIIKSRFNRLFKNSGDIPRNMSSIYNIMTGDYLDSPASQWLNESDKIVTVTFRELNDNVKSMAKYLSDKLGANQKGKFVGLSMDNSHLWQVCFWALLMSGYKPVLIDINHKEEMVDYIIESSGAQAILGREKIDLKNKVMLISIDELKSALTKKADSFVPQWADNLALCTSGTTATAKVLVFDGSAIVYQIEGFYRVYLKDQRIARAPTPVKSLAFLPMHHVLGFITLCIAYPFLNTTVVFLKDRSPASIQAACQKIGVTHMVSVPLLINNLKNGVLRKIRNEEPQKEKLLNLLSGIALFIQKIAPRKGDAFVRKCITKPIIKKLFGTTFAWICVGGTHVPVDSLKFINGLGHVATIGYGMTECGIIAFEPGLEFKRRTDGSTGPLMYGFESKIIDTNGKETHTGELILKSKSMHIGRMQKGKMISADIDAEGYLHTGDIAHFERGSLVIEGRLKEVILNESGENIYPDELEDKFDNMPLVKKICILGINNKGKEEIVLVVEMQEDAKDEKILNEISNKVFNVNAMSPVMKQINRLYITYESMPLANGFKVRRQKLKELLEKNDFTVTELQIKTHEANTQIIKREENQKTDIKDEKFLEIREKVVKCFAEVLDMTPDRIGYDMRFIEDLGGDSLDSLGLLVMAETRFGVMVEENDYYRCKTANDVARLLYEKITGSYTGKAAVHAENVAPIKIFEDTPEFKAFTARLESLKGIKNPYFIAHDSTLRDISVVNGKEVLNFGSYNYLGLSGHPQVNDAAIEAIKKLGTSASGSRLLAGEKTLHEELEKEIASWKHTEDAIVLVGGHSTNVTFVGNFCNSKDLILYDAMSHNSVAQGIQLSNATSRLFPHNDFNSARAILTSIRGKFEKVLLIIEGVYSMDGDIAPVPEFVKLKKEFGLFLMVDEAHSSCTIGKNGGGVDDYFNLNPDDIDIKMGTLSKGLGTCGGYLAGKKSMIEFLRYSLPGFVFSVGLSPALTAATLEAVRIIRKDNSLVAKLQENIKHFVNKSKENGFNLCMAKESPIVPILVGKDADAFALSQALFEKGIFVPPAVYPAVPANKARLRFCLTSCHNKNQIDQALDALKELSGKMNIVLPK